MSSVADCVVYKPPSPSCPSLDWYASFHVEGQDLQSESFVWTIYPKYKNSILCGGITVCRMYAPMLKTQFWEHQSKRQLIWWHHYNISVCLSSVSSTLLLLAVFPLPWHRWPQVYTWDKGRGFQNAPCYVLLHLRICGSSLSGWSASTYAIYHLRCGHKQSGSVECQDKACWFQRDLFKCDSCIGIKNPSHCNFPPCKLG